MLGQPEQMVHCNNKATQKWRSNETVVSGKYFTDIKLDEGYYLVKNYTIRKSTTTFSFVNKFQPF